jgi:hypothetical protein
MPEKRRVELMCGEVCALADKNGTLRAGIAQRDGRQQSTEASRKRLQLDMELQCTV